MKITIELTDHLVARVRQYAVRHGLTLRAVVEDGIRLVLRSEQTRTAFRLRDASVDGFGLQEPFRDAEWARLREAVYEGRGG